jgi:threonine dehydrogenase-like Zn-dependent dehydrogenase
MAQQLGTVVLACKRLPNMVGKRAVVIGQGSAGLFFNAMLSRLGARQIVALDVVEARVAAAERFGATCSLDISGADPVAAVKEATGGQLGDLVVEAVGEPETINLMPKLVREGGTIMAFGIPRGPYRLEFDYFSLFLKKCVLTSSAGSVHEPGRVSTRMALDLIAGGQVDATPMLTHRLPFSRAPEAYELARSRADGVIKIVIDMRQ